MTKNEIIKIMKSGEFTIAFHDNESCLFYKGKHEYEDLPKKGTDLDEQWFSDGYETTEVLALVEALGGKVVSI